MGQEAAEAGIKMTNIDHQGVKTAINAPQLLGKAQRIPVADGAFLAFMGQPFSTALASVTPTPLPASIGIPMENSAAATGTEPNASGAALPDLPFFDTANVIENTVVMQGQAANLSPQTGIANSASSAGGGDQVWYAASPEISGDEAQDKSTLTSDPAHRVDLPNPDQYPLASALPEQTPVAIVPSVNIQTLETTSDIPLPRGPNGHQPASPQVSPQASPHGGSPVSQSDAPPVQTPIIWQPMKGVWQNSTGTDTPRVGPAFVPPQTRLDPAISTLGTASAKSPIITDASPLVGSVATPKTVVPRQNAIEKGQAALEQNKTHLSDIIASRHDAFFPPNLTAAKQLSDGSAPQTTVPTHWQGADLMPAAVPDPDLPTALKPTQNLPSSGSGLGLGSSTPEQTLITQQTAFAVPISSNQQPNTIAAPLTYPTGQMVDRMKSSLQSDPPALTAKTQLDARVTGFSGASLAQPLLRSIPATDLGPATAAPRLQPTQQPMPNSGHVPAYSITTTPIDTTPEMAKTTLGLPTIGTSPAGPMLQSAFHLQTTPQTTSPDAGTVTNLHNAALTAHPPNLPSKIAPREAEAPITPTPATAPTKTLISDRVTHSDSVPTTTAHSNINSGSLGSSTPAPATAPNPVPIQMLVQHIRQHAASGKPHSVELALSPEELGKVHLLITPDGDRLRIIIQAERCRASTTLSASDNHLGRF